MGFARVQPILVWGPGSQEVGIARTPPFLLSYFLASLLVSFFVRPRAVSSSRPRSCRSAASQPQSRLAVVVLERQAPLLTGHALTAASPARGWMVGTKRAKRSRDEWRDVILDWAVKLNTESTASPCIRSGARTRYPNLSCTSESKAQKRRDQSTKRVSNPRMGTVTRLSRFTSAVIARAAVQEVGRSTAPVGTTPLVR